MANRRHTITNASANCTTTTTLRQHDMYFTSKCVRVFVTWLNSAQKSARNCGHKTMRVIALRIGLNFKSIYVHTTHTFHAIRRRSVLVLIKILNAVRRNVCTGSCGRCAAEHPTKKKWTYQCSPACFNQEGRVRRIGTPVWAIDSPSTPDTVLCFNFCFLYWLNLVCRFQVKAIME